MCANRLALTALGLALLLMPAATAAAVPPEQHLGAHFREPEPLSEVLERRCANCHTLWRVRQAMQERRDLREIVERMEARGAVLDQRDREVLGTFWGDPLKTRSDSAPAGPPPVWEEYRALIENRCVTCHTRERIDEAIRRQLPFATVEEILLQRGVVLTERERQVLGVFWGEPL